MKAAEVVFQKLLDGSVQFQVPLFQRTYNWNDEQWEPLWEDILETYSMDDPRNHFIGAIVTQPVGNPAGATNKFLLIDGQQRFTTLLVILACIRKRADLPDHPTGDPLLAAEIWDNCLVNKYSTGDDFLKFRPTQRDRQPFESVLRGDAPPSGNRVFEAFAFFDNKLQKGDLEENPIDLRRLKVCITNQLDLVSINLEAADSAHRIFESLNNTGMQLGPSDLVRNLLFMEIKDETDAQYAYDHHWFPMQEKTGEALDDFFWRYLMINGILPRWDETFEEIKKSFVKAGSQPLVALAEYAKFSQYYRWLRGKEQVPDQKQIVNQISRLNKWEVSVAYPFLMKAFEFWESGEVVSGDLLNVMHAIESFVVRRTVCAIPTNRLRRIFARMASQIDRSSFVESSREYLRGENWPTDQQFRSAFVRYPLYYASRIERTRLILESLERSLDSKEFPLMTDDITVEHIMPQSLTDEWRLMLGSDWQENHRTWLHTPGNLTLTGHNPELSNASFGRKKQILANAIFALTKDILNAETWDHETIEARGEALAELAITIWRR